MMLFSLPLLSFADPVVVTIQDNCDANVVFQIQDYNVDDDKFHSATIIGSSGASFGSFSIDPDWGTFIFSGVSISNYKGFGRISVQYFYNGEWYEQEFTVVECCQNPMSYDHIFVDEDIPPATYNGNIYLYGDVRIVGSTSFDNADVYLATDAQITFVPSVTLVADNSLFTKLCEYAWDRIFVNDGGSMFDAINSTLEESIRGVYSFQNGQIISDGNTFLNNHMSLYVGSHSAGTSSVSLTGTSFDFDRVFDTKYIHPSSPLLSGIDNYLEKSCVGIGSAYSIHALVESSDNVVLGSVSGSANHYRNTDSYGQDMSMLNLWSSQTSVYNSQFYDGQTSVCALENSKLAFGGTLTNAGNTVRGLTEVKESSALMQGNDFRNAVTIFEPVNTTVTGSFQGINIVDDNVFSDLKLSITGDNTAVRTRVLDNDFTRARIDVTKIKGTTGNRLIINNNLFESPSASYSQNNFIRVLDCDNLSVSDNEIENYSSYTPSGSLSPNGILLDDATDAIVTGNTLKNVEKGIEITGFADDMQLYCNVFNTYWRGIHLDSPSNFPSQGLAASTGADNAWTVRIVGSNTISGTLPTGIWYYFQPFIGDIRDPNAGLPSFPNMTGVSVSNLTVSSNFVSSSFCPYSSPNFKTLSPVRDINNSSGFSVYPNPAQNIVWVETEKATHQIHILNSRGQLVHKEALKGNVTKLDLSKLSSGIYQLRYDHASITLVIK